MSELLVEVYSEEIPARMQNKAAADFEKLFIDFFHKQNIKFSKNKISSYVTPRRLVFVACDIEEFQISAAKEIIGPSINAPEKAIEGFLKSIDVKDVSELKEIENKKGRYYCYNLPKKEINTSQIIEKHLPQILQKMASLWPKSMVWLNDESQVRWVRPIRNILCIFNKKIVPFEFAGLKSNDKSFGHLFLSSKSFKVTDFEQYNKKLSESFVILDAKQRRDIIISEVKSICKKLGCHTTESLEDNNALLDEVVGLVEYPVTMVGEINKEFMSLPYEVLVLTLKLHQKYFCLKDKKGNLAPYFIFVANVKTDNSDKIIADNQKVLSARLNDAKFFIEEDLKVPLASRIEGLKNIIFHKKLGSIYHKVKRLEILNKFIAIWIPHANLTLAERLADLAKSDLITKGVAELPELQGIIGKYYAKIQGEPDEVSEALAEQYLPVGINSELPKTSLGVLLAISDKIDTICGLFLINEKPTSSKDPFALRRSVLGIIRIIIHYQIHLPLRILIDKAINCFPAKVIKDSYPEKSAKEIKLLKTEVSAEIINFFVERLKSFLRDTMSVRQDVINEVFYHYVNNIGKDKKCDILMATNKAIFISNFVGKKENLKIIELYKRAANIVAIEERKDGKEYDGKPHFLSLKTKYEKALYKRVKYMSPKVKKLASRGHYDEVFAILLELETPLNRFFDNVIVNVSEESLRINRLLILAKIRKLFNNVFDFSKIEIS